MSRHVDIYQNGYLYAVMGLGSILWAQRTSLHLTCQSICRFCVEKLSNITPKSCPKSLHVYAKPDHLIGHPALWEQHPLEHLVQLPDKLDGLKG